MKRYPAEDLGRKALDLLRNLDLDTVQIAEITGWPENFVVMAMDEEREREHEAKRASGQLTDNRARGENGGKVAAGKG